MRNSPYGRAWATCTIAFLLALLWTPHFAAANDYRSETRSAEKLGALIQNYDQSAWHATDRLVERVGNPGEIEGLKGWITVPDGRSYITKFIAERGTEPVVVWEAGTRGKRVRYDKMHETTMALTPQEIALWRARQTVLKSDFESCPNFTPMNMIVFPNPNNDDQIYIYLFSASKKWSEIVLGKHYRFTISADGQTLLNQRAYSKSCFAISGQTPDGAKVVGAVASHLLAPHPEEHHVFASLSRNIDIYVTTPESGALWQVSKGKIKLVKP